MAGQKLSQGAVFSAFEDQILAEGPDTIAAILIVTWPKQCLCGQLAWGFSQCNR